MAEYLTETYAICSAGDDTEEMVICGRTDGMAALQQAIELMLSVECGVYAIFSDRYGVNLMDLLGKPYPYAVAEIERRIREALLRDERILAVEDFTFAADADKLSVNFTVKSIYGESSGQAEVNI